MKIHPIGSKVRIIKDTVDHRIPLGSIIIIDGYNAWHNNNRPSYRCRGMCVSSDDCVEIVLINQLHPRIEVL
jgi:hypothetical protein